MIKGLSESVFKDAPDQAFRVRVVSEYARIHNWLGREMDLNSARILDFGCGQGFAAASFALRHPGAEVVGFDVSSVDESYLAHMLESQLGVQKPLNLRFVSGIDGSLQDLPKFDLVYSWSVFEHIREDQVNEAFSRLREQLDEHGKFFLQIDPLYFSPKGSHLYKYFSLPWHHLMLSLDQLHEVVFQLDADQSRQQREWQQFVELNRLTATDFLGRAKFSGFNLKRNVLRKTELEPPKRLLRCYAEDALLTEELVALFE